MLGEAQKQLRPKGVRVVDGPDTGLGPPQKLIGVTEAKFVVVGFYDERGAERTMVVMQVGERYYAPPNAIEWAQKLRPVSRWLADQMKRQKLERAPVDVPDTDAVDVVESGSGGG
jgi:hypothetical protein